MVAYTAWAQLRAATKLDNERRISCGSATRQQIKVDEVDTELHDEYGGPIRSQPESAERTTLSNGGTSLKKRRNPRAMTHSCYATVGGFAFDTSDVEPNFLPNHRSHLCISVFKLSYIVTKVPELIPNISEIKSKTKAKLIAW